MPYATMAYDPAGATASADTTGTGSASGTAIELQGVEHVLVQWTPPDQAYYWSDAWQCGELETLASLAMGGGRRFDTADDLIEWLRSDDED